MIKGIIMDLDGTILDSMKIWDTAGERYLSSQGKTAKEGFRKTVYPMTLEESALYIKKEYLPDKSAEEIKSGVLSVIQNFYENEVPLKEIGSKLLTVIRKMKLPMAAATSSDHDQIIKAFRRLGILNDFQKILTCTEAGEGKHSPKIYHMAAAYLREFNYPDEELLPEHFLVFEDARYCLETAKKAGFHTSAVFDTSGEKDWEKLKRSADFSLKGTETKEEIRNMILSL